MKRANGTGAVVRLSGNRRRPWAARISLRDPQGCLIQHAISYHTSAADAQRALEAHYHSFCQRERFTPYVTVGQVFDSWSAREYRKLNPGSITCHNAAWNMRVSRFAGCPIAHMTLDRWQSILDEDERLGLSRSVIMNDAILIRALNRYAMERDLIPKDYSAYLDVPQVGIKNPRGALSETQVARLSHMAREGVPYADTALMLCYTGFRVNEFLALTGASYHADGGGYLQGGLKSAAGRDRIVPVHPSIAPYLSSWLSRQGDTIICRDSGAPMRDAEYRRCFAPLMQSIGAPDATPHWCRHTFATRLHAAGADPITVKWLMGHSTRTDITAHYTHQSVSVLRAALLLLP